MAYNNNLFYNNNNNNNNYALNNNYKNINKKASTDTSDFSLNNGEPILVYDSFDSDSDEPEKSINNKNNNIKKIKKGKSKRIYKIVKKDEEKPKDNNISNKTKNMDQGIQYGIVPRVGSRRKTIVVQDETGKELSRIVSSTGNIDPVQNNQPDIRRTSIIAPVTYPQPYMVQPQPPPPLYPQPQIIMQAPPPYQAPLMMPQQTYYMDNSYFTQPLTNRSQSLKNDVIAEEAEIKKRSDSRVKSSVIGAINSNNSNKIADSSHVVSKSKTKFKVCSKNQT